MFKRRTLFIVGAGASCEFDLPPGPGLAKTISEKVNIASDRYRSYDGDDDRGITQGDPISYTPCGGSNRTASIDLLAPRT
jgi:hypothetical protein